LIPRRARGGTGGYATCGEDAMTQIETLEALDGLAGLAGLEGLEGLDGIEALGEPDDPDVPGDLPEDGPEAPGEAGAKARRGAFACGCADCRALRGRGAERG